VLKCSKLWDVDFWMARPAQLPTRWRSRCDSALLNDPRTLLLPYLGRHSQTTQEFLVKFTERVLLPLYTIILKLWFLQLVLKLFELEFGIVSFYPNSVLIIYQVNLVCLFCFEIRLEHLKFQLMVWRQ
jgi:hypothetical protein